MYSRVPLTPPPFHVPDCRVRALGYLPVRLIARIVRFRYRYTLGNCGPGDGVPGRNEGVGPTVRLRVGGIVQSSRDIDAATEDYPYDFGCGGTASRVTSASWSPRYVGVPLLRG